MKGSLVAFGIPREVLRDAMRTPPVVQVVRVQFFHPSPLASCVVWREWRLRGLR